MAEHGAKNLRRLFRHRPHVVEDGDAGFDLLVLLRVVADHRIVAGFDGPTVRADSTPARMRNSVVLPAPFNPMIKGRSALQGEADPVKDRLPTALTSPSRRSGVRPDGSGWGKRSATPFPAQATSTRSRFSRSAWSAWCAPCAIVSVVPEPADGRL